MELTEKKTLRPRKEIFSVQRLNATVRTLLEGTLPPLWIEGEISNFSCPRSGHWYFTLKDSAAQVRCAMFRGHNINISLIPQDGMHVLLHAQVSLYENRGDYQLIADYLEPLGDGEWQRVFNLLKNKLLHEGLFDHKHKKTIPPFPSCIGIVTSATGAAIRDILKIIRHRCASMHVIVYPSMVQGIQAGSEINQTLMIAIARNECDVLILARGGGSIEDLWAFNNEDLARTIVASPIPIITGIGHEIDFTIADFVADERTPTPSAAAARACPNKEEVYSQIRQLHYQLMRAVIQHAERTHLKLIEIKHRLSKFQQKIFEQSQKLDNLEQQLQTYLFRLVSAFREKLQNCQLKLIKHHPKQHIEKNYLILGQLHHALLYSMRNQFCREKQKLHSLGQTLHTLSPLATLERGYAIVWNERNEIIRSSRHLKIGETIHIQLNDGALESKILSNKFNPKE